MPGIQFCRVVGRICAYELNVSLHVSIVLYMRMILFADRCITLVEFINMDAVILQYYSCISLCWHHYVVEYNIVLLLCRYVDGSWDVTISTQSLYDYTFALFLSCYNVIVLHSIVFTRHLFANTRSLFFLIININR